MASFARLGRRVYDRTRPDPWSGPLRRLSATAEAYRPLHVNALLFDRIALAKAPRSVNVLLPAVNPFYLTAGPMTAVRFGKMLAEALDLPLRIVTTSTSVTARSSHSDGLARRLGTHRLRVDHVGRGRTAKASEADVWVATSWQSALACTVAARCSLIAPSQVVYLVQDYEPGFVEWSTAFASAKLTYHSGFCHVVNSSPLAKYLREQEDVTVEDYLILAPDLDVDRLREVASQRATNPRAVFFYSRHIARNLFDLGVSTLYRAAAMAKREWRLVLAGQVIETPRIPGIEIENLGRTSYDEYFELMARTQIALSLMFSPHPSHPPLDWATSGGWAVTNRFGQFREDLHPRVLTAEPDPDQLGRALADAIDSADIGDFALPVSMGRRMPEVVEAVSAKLS